MSVPSKTVNLSILYPKFQKLIVSTTQATSLVPSVTEDPTKCCSEIQKWKNEMIELLSFIFKMWFLTIKQNVNVINC